MNRVCKKCGKEKPQSEFYGNIYTCKRCICSHNSEKRRKINDMRFPDLPGESWRDINEYENEYIVSNMGRVKSIQHKCNMILNPSKHRQGYLRIRIGQKYMLVHRLVAESFIKNPFNKLTVNHINGNKSDNRVINLEWATQSENNIHAIKTGLRCTTDKTLRILCLNAKLDKTQVLSLKEDGLNNLSLSEIAKKYGISKAQACRIINNKSRASTLKYL